MPWLGQCFGFFCAVCSMTEFLSCISKHSCHLSLNVFFSRSGEMKLQRMVSGTQVVKWQDTTLKGNDGYDAISLKVSVYYKQQLYTQLRSKLQIYQLQQQNSALFCHIVDLQISQKRYSCALFTKESMHCIVYGPQSLSLVVCSATDSSIDGGLGR